MTVTDWIDEFMDMVRRRLRIIFLVAFLGTIVSLLYALAQVHLYTSIAVLQVQGAKVAEDLAPEVAPGAGARNLQIVEQRIMSQGMVREIATELGLWNEMGGLTDAEKVGLIRASVRVNGVAAAREGPRDDGAVSLVRISADWTDRESAQALAARIAELTINLNRQSQLERARETLAFFRLREEELATRIVRLEEEIAIFRRENDLAEPMSREFQQREIATLRQEVLSVDRQIIELDRQLSRQGDESALSRVEKQQRTETVELRNNLVDQRAYLQERLEAASDIERRDPQLELQLAKLERKLEGLNAEQAEVVDRRKAAEVRYQLEQRGQSEQFGILEEASYPDYPSTPSRTKMAFMGMLASIGLALAVAYLLELRNPVLRSAARMEHELGFHPVVTVPQARAARRGGVLSWVFGLAFGRRRRSLR